MEVLKANMKKWLSAMLAFILVMSIFTGVAVYASATEDMKAYLPPVLVKGFSYTLPELDGDLYVNGQASDGTFVADGSAVSVEYKGLLSCSIPVVDTNNSANHSAFFYDTAGKVKAVETADYITLSFGGSGETLFINPLSVYSFTLNMEFVDSATNFESFYVTLTDAQNQNVSLTVSVDPAAGTITYGEETANISIVGGMMILKYSDSSRSFQDDSSETRLFTVTEDDQGQPFAGFPGGAYMTLGVRNAVGNSEVHLKRLNNQPLGHRDSAIVDQTEPTIKLTSVLESKQHYDMDLVIPDFEAYDVYSDIAAKSVSVQSPSGTELFSGSVSEYTPIKIDETGKYRIVYRAEDSNGNKGELVRQVAINDSTPPALEVSSMKKNTYSLNATVEVPSYTASDNLGQCTVDAFLILPNGEMKLLSHDDNGQITYYIKNIDLNHASFGVSDTEFRAEQTGEYTFRFVAYDDLYNRTVVEVPFTVK